MEQTFIQAKDFNEARKKIREVKNENIIFSGKTDTLNRNVLEKEQINTLLLNLKGRKDRMKQRDSGFNHVLAKTAKKKNVKIGINLDEVIESDGKEKAKMLGRVMQNIRICNKNKLKMRFISPSNKYKKDFRDLEALGIVLGMPTWMLK